MASHLQRIRAVLHGVPEPWLHVPRLVPRPAFFRRALQTSSITSAETALTRIHLKGSPDTLGGAILWPPTFSHRYLLAPAGVEHAAPALCLPDEQERRSAPRRGNWGRHGDGRRHGRQAGSHRHVSVHHGHQKETNKHGLREHRHGTDGDCHNVKPWLRLDTGLGAVNSA